MSATKALVKAQFREELFAAQLELPMLLDDVVAMKALADKLAKCEAVSRYDSNDEPEAVRLAQALSDLEGSFHEILYVLLPALINAESNEEIEETLNDIRDELRHVAYHLKDPQYFFSLLKYDLLD